MAWRFLKSEGFARIVHTCEYHLRSSLYKIICIVVEIIIIVVNITHLRSCIKAIHVQVVMHLHVIERQGCARVLLVHD